MSEWQPIETAPRDGAEFLGAAMYDGTWVFLVSEWKENTEKFWGAPTHWMPLPPPPSPA